MTINKRLPFPLVFVDPNSPENAESDKRYKEFVERRAKNDAKIENQAKEYYRTHLQSAANYYGTGSSAFQGRDYPTRYTQTNVLVSADKTPTEETVWLIPGWIPEGEITLLVGPPNSGKNTIANYCAAACSRGVNFSLWQGAAPTRSGDTISSSTEEKFAGKGKLKFKAAGGDTKCFHNLKGMPDPQPTNINNTRRCNFSDPDYAVLRNVIRGVNNLAIMILDPVSQVIPGRSGNYAKDRESYEKLAQFTEELKFAALGIHHTTKSTKGKGIYSRPAGSGAAAQVARSIIMVTEIKGWPMASGARYVMVLAKAFDDPVNYGITYSIENHYVDDDGVRRKSSRIVWHDLIPGTPEEILELAESGEMVTGKIDPLDAAVIFLKETLKSDPVLVSEIKKQAKAEGITTRDLAQAKKTLGVIHYKQSGAGQSSSWLWCLPRSESK